MRRKTKGIRYRPPADAKTCKKWGALLPEPEPNAWRWHDLPDGPKRWLVLADLHIPFHDNEAITAALTYGERQRCDGLLLLGDVADCYRLSKFVTDPRVRRFPEEVDAVGKTLDVFQKVGFKATVLKFGNHEFRSERYLQSRAAELFGIPQFTFESFLKLHERNVIAVPAYDPISVGKLAILHGHEFGVRFSSPVNPARGTYLRAKECVIAAHEHRSSEHTEQTLRGTTVTCWSVGCLCDLHPAYRPINNWNHGFAVLDLSGDEWSIRNHRIINGCVL